jgi:ATP synthase protein I
MIKAIYLQVGATLVTALIVALAMGRVEAVSTCLGGVASIVPNFLFALRLKSLGRRPGASYPANFFVGEIVKVAATIGLLVVIIRSWGAVHWPTLLLGLAVALNAAFFAFWKKS